MTTNNADRGRIVTPSDPELVVLCPKCGQETYHTIRAQYDRSGFVDGPDIHWWENHQIVQCDGCRTVSFRQVSGNSEDSVYDQFTDEEQPMESVTLLPKRLDGCRPLEHAFELPRPVRDLYEEILTATIEPLRVLVGIGIRTLVEAVCKERGASGRDLEKRIDDLVTKGVLTPDGAEILHGTRLLGNEATHEAKPLSNESLNAALQVVEHLLTTTYILPTIASKLPQRSKPKPGSGTN